MKKLLCIVLVAVMVLALSVSAFAAGSVTKDVADSEATAALPVVEEKKEAKVELVDEKGAVIEAAPEEILIMLPVDEANKSLEGEELEAFEKAYEAAKAEEEYVVTNFFWLDVTPEYKEVVSGGNGIKLTFDVPGLKAGDTVKVFVNGVEIPAEFITINEDGTITVLFYELGAVAIMTKAAA